MHRQIQFKVSMMFRLSFLVEAADQPEIYGTDDFVSPAAVKLLAENYISFWGVKVLPIRDAKIWGLHAVELAVYARTWVVY